MRIILKGAANLLGHPQFKHQDEIISNVANVRFRYTKCTFNAFAVRKRFNLPVHLVDERLSTVEARSQLFDLGGYRQVMRCEVDSIAACIILEQWLS